MNSIPVLRSFSLIAFLLADILSDAQTGDFKDLWLGDITTIKNFESGFTAPKNNTCFSGETMRIGGRRFENGLGARAISTLFFDVGGYARHFSAMVGHDDGSRPNTAVKFYVIGDRKILWESDLMKIGDAARKVDVDLTGIKKLALLVTDDAAGEHAGYADWAEAKISTRLNELSPVKFKSNKYILTPAPADKPKINGASIFGARPGSPFLFTISATGLRPMKFSAARLPEGLSLDPASGRITGKVNTPGKYTVALTAGNRTGSATKTLRVIIGDTICLTPPIGWNGWNSWAREIDQNKVLASAKAMVQSGLVNHGWSYVNIDDTWQGQRGGKFNAIQGNERFPDFKGMIDEVHSMGLKMGLYSTPWIASYAGFAGESSDFEQGQFTAAMKNEKRNYRHTGKFRFESNDAEQWAEWGIDYLKYDWRIDVASAATMSKALRNSGRDIVYSISNSAPFEKVADWQRLCTVWRTGGDIRDNWQSLYYSGFTIDKWGPYGGPGHWNDPDMLIVGDISTGSEIHPTRLTADEQYAHVSLWSLLAAPLLIGCPVERMDDFTRGLLTNDEVIDIDQDALGKPGRLVSNENGTQVWARQMEDGSLAVGLFNTANFGATPQSFFNWENDPPVSMSIAFSSLGLTGKYNIRDVWRQKDLGVFDHSFKTTVPFHGVLLIRMYPQQP